MLVRWIRAVVAMALLASGALLHAASWQRWAGACPFPGGPDTRACDVRQDHLYDFLVVADPWQPVGTAAEQAGIALLLVAFALLLAPWGFLVRPGRYHTVALLFVALTYAGVGTATLRSGVSGEVVDPLLGNAAFSLWFFVSTPVLVWIAVRARGWARASAVFLVLASPLVMGFSYAIGPFDANPWYEAYCGDLTASPACACSWQSHAPHGHVSRPWAPTRPPVPPDPRTRRCRRRSWAADRRTQRGRSDCSFASGWVASAASEIVSDTSAAGQLATYGDPSASHYMRTTSSLRIVAHAGTR